MERCNLESEPERDDGSCTSMRAFGSQLEAKLLTNTACQVACL